jgi:hypothetical protein
MLPKDDIRSRRIRERAYLLADSGLHDGWRSIERTLMGEGWPNCRSVLESEFVRRSIDSRCAHARQQTVAA